jgi:NAD+ synthase (glutamine-hydrolysing)
MSPNRFRVALAQTNTTVGDLHGNTSKIVAAMGRAREAGADVVAFPELALTGYPPEDLLLKPQFLRDSRRALDDVIKVSQGITCVLGFAEADDDVYNAAAVISDGSLAGVYRKMFLPNYGVFDEERYFKAGTECPVFSIGGVQVGVNICEDIWHALGPTVAQKRAGAEVIININASPYSAGKLGTREKFVATRALDNELFVCYVNLVGGQDELVFDGASLIYGPDGDLIARGRQFQEDLVIADLNVDSLLRHRLRSPLQRKRTLASVPESMRTPLVTVPAVPTPARQALPSQKAPVLEPVAEVYRALTLATHDYVVKSGFQKVVIGLSGGIDSALVAAIAADALGPEAVVGVSMPSRYNAPESLTDAKELAANLGIGFMVIPIEDVFKATLQTMEPAFRDTVPGLAEENVQARIRGVILMALSNKFGWLVLSTGNKSEMAMGYATLYGDMAGGFAMLKDVLKTLVYDLSTYRNRIAGRKLVPQSIIDKAPTAELRPNQKDEDSLPPYAVLDPVLRAYVEEDHSYEEMLEMGFDQAVVRQVISGVDRNEYKRRQAAPGVKITGRAFGRDRRLPIVNRYRPF